MAESFSKAAKHPLRINPGPHASEGYAAGWNDAVTVSLNVGGPPEAPSAWYPKDYKSGWASCRALLVTMKEGQFAVVAASTLGA